MRTTLAAVATALCAAAFLVACPPQNVPQPIPPPPNPPPGYQPPPGDDGAGPVATPIDAPDAPAGGAEGAPCTLDLDCASGVCEGQGCGEGEGRCAAAERMCTRDLVSFCSCDGVTFEASSSCPGQRYASRGACDQPRPDGAACLDASDCASGVCEGLGCTDDQPGVCVARARACTKDLRPYCGCDGATFRTSGSCPGRRYQAKGPCP